MQGTPFVLDSRQQKKLYLVAAEINALKSTWALVALG
jgi:hypothetical protein